MSEQDRRTGTDRITGAFFFLLGIAIAWASARLRLGNFHHPGPGFFPLLVGLAIVLLSAWLLVFPGKTGSDATRFTLKHLKRVGAVYAGLLVFFFILETAGFLVSSFLLLFYLFYIAGKKRVARALILAVITTGLTYLLFETALKSELPKGLLNF